MCTQQNSIECKVKGQIIKNMHFEYIVIILYARAQGERACGLGTAPIIYNRYYFTNIYIIYTSNITIENISLLLNVTVYIINYKHQYIETQGIYFELSV